MLIDTITEHKFLDHPVIQKSFSRNGATLIFNILDDEPYPTEFDPQYIASAWHEADLKELKYDYKHIDAVAEAQTLEEIDKALRKYTTVAGISEEYDYTKKETINRLVFDAEF